MYGISLTLARNGYRLSGTLRQSNEGDMERHNSRMHLHDSIDDSSMGPITVRICQWCGGLFEPPRSPNKRYRIGKLTDRKTCGPECARALRVARYTAGLTPVVPSRRCTVCGQLFDLWRVKGSGTWTRAKTCGRGCQNIARSSAMEQAHERAALDPERYQQWVGRDYRAMGQARHKPATRPANKPNYQRARTSRGKGW